jgi:multiple sugar transport system substrate-binding protein
MKTKLFLTVVILLVSAVLVFGAGEQEVSEEKPVEIVFRTNFHGGQETIIEDIVNDFMEKNPTITVDLRQGQWTEHYAQVKLAVSAGEAPNIITLHYNKLVELQDYMDPIDASPVGNLIEMADIDPALYTKAGWEASQRDGHQYCVPFDVHGWFLYYNQDIFKEAGVDPDPANFPADRESFYTACDKISAAGHSAYQPIELPHPRFARRAWAQLLWQQGGELFEKNYTKATFNNDKGLKALEELRKVYFEYGYNDPGTDGWKQFAAGDLGVHRSGGWTFGLSQESLDNWATYGAVKFYDKAVDKVTSDLIGFPKQPKGTPKEEYLATMELCKFLSEESWRWTLGTVFLATYLPALENAILLESQEWQKVGLMFANHVDSGHGHYPINHIKGSELENAIQTQVDLVVKGQLDSAEALRLAEEECNRVLSQ